MKVLHRGLEVMDWDSVQKSLRQFAGVNLDKNRRIPSNWVIVKEEILTGEKGSCAVRIAVFPETFTGFAKGKGQQSAGGFMGAGTKNLGIEIEVEDLSTGEIGSDRTFGDISFDRQDELFRDALTVISRTITSVSSVASPQQRQGDMSQVGLLRNPADWIVGDKVNVSRHTLDGGGLTVGYVVRVYPTSVDVLFPPDEFHNKGLLHTHQIYLISGAIFLLTLQKPRLLNLLVFEEMDKETASTKHQKRWQLYLNLNFLMLELHSSSFLQPILV